MLSFGPLTHQDRTGASFKVRDQSLFHGEGAVAMTAGQTTRKHVMIRNKREISSVNGLVFTAQVPNQSLPSNGVKAQGALELLGCFGDRSCRRKAKHLLDRSGRLHFLVYVGR